MPTYQNTQSILLSLNNTDEPTVIYQPSLINHEDLPSTQRFNGYITDLRLRTQIASLIETPLPEFELGASKTAKMALIRDLEYSSPRYNLQILLRKGEEPWLPIFDFAVHCRKPFFMIEVLGYLTQQPALAIAPDTALGIQFTNVGYGVPQSNDQIICYGVAREEFSTPDPPIIIQSVLPISPDVTEDLDMPISPPINVPLTRGSGFDSSYQAVDNYASGLSYRLLVYPDLKIGMLEFTLECLEASDHTVALTWDSAYGVGAKPLRIVPVFHGVGNIDMPNGWFEVTNSEMVWRSNHGPNLSGAMDGRLVFAIP